MSKVTHTDQQEDQDRLHSRRTFLIGTGFIAGGLTLSTTRISAASTPEQPLAPKPPDAAGSAFDFTGITMPRRKSFFDLSDDEVTQFEAAYAKLKALPANDPKQWLNQANLHGGHCGGSLFEVHSGWWFTVWHRCYLFFYERILASLCNNPASFALPYWDWEQHPSVPNTRIKEQQGKQSPFLDKTSPLYDANRFPKADTTFANDPNTSNAAAYCNSTYIHGQLLADGDFTNFCGGDPTANGSAGDLEQFPHNNVHIWIGLNDDKHQGQDMDDLATAAQDPLFFLHHANIDRIFSLWLGAKNTLPPPESPWYTQLFSFVDEKGNQVSVTVNEALNHMAGNYQPPQQLFALTSAPQELTLGGPATTLPNLAIPDRLKEKLTTRPLVGAAQGEPRSIRLRFEGVERPHNVPLILQVFVNKPDATLKDVNGPNFVGTLTMLPSSKTPDKPHRAVDLSLEVGQKVRELFRSGKPVSVTVVAADPGFGRAKGAGPLKATFKKISVVTKD